MTRVIAAAVACLLLDLVAAQFPYRAIARMRGATAAGSAVAGTVTFEQQAPLSPVTVSVQISGLRPGTHGFHVHQFGDVRVTANLDTISAHFVPQCAPPDVDENGQQVGGCENDQVHGLPPSLTRQPGDMGNIEVGYDGLVTPASRSLIIGESKMSLADPLRSIIGRTVVVHAERDDGLPPYGNAGGPEAYGVIGLASTPVGTSNSALAPTVPHVTKVICTFEGASTVGGQANNVGSVSGSALLHLLEPHQPGVVRMQARLLGLQRDSTHSFHFHEWGDMTVGLTGSGMGPIYAENAIVVDKVKVNSQGYGLFDEEFRTDSLLQHVGRALTIHEGPDSSSPTIAAAVCGLANPNAVINTAGAQTSSSAGGLSGGVVALLVCMYYHRMPIPCCGKYLYLKEGQMASAQAPPPPGPPPPGSGVTMQAAMEPHGVRVEKL